jgi:competence protein ComEA
MLKLKTVSVGLCLSLSVFSASFALADDTTAPTTPSTATTSTTVVTERRAAIEKVNINTADVKTLEAVRGLGKTTAAAIVAYRDAHGAFTSVQDLLKVKGMTQAKLARLAPRLTV